MLPLARISLFSLLLLATAARADVLDQSHAGPGTLATFSVTTSFSYAQTFTVGQSGTLTRLRLVLSRTLATTPGDELTIDLRPTDGSGAPLEDDGSALGAIDVPSDVLPNSFDETTFHELDFSSFGIEVTAGEELAIVARSNVPFAGGRLVAWAVFQDDGAGYPGGSTWTRSNSTWSANADDDVPFETYVEVPEPAGGTGTALLALLVLRRRMRRS